MKVKKNTSIKEKAYEAFKLYWMSTHGYSIFDLTSELHKILESFDWDNDRMPTKEELFSEFEEVGFNGEIYPCYDEFIDNEYQDSYLMGKVLDGESYKEYIVSETIERGEKYVTSNN